LSRASAHRDDRWLERERRFSSNPLPNLLVRKMLDPYQARRIRRLILTGIAGNISSSRRTTHISGEQMSTVIANLEALLGLGVVRRAQQ
jgi:hypothetical protein